MITTEQMPDPMPDLPSFEEIGAKNERGEKLNPLEHFIFENEPALDEFSRSFRRELVALIKFVSSNDGLPNTGSTHRE